jgi:hypothetical protein
MANVTDQMVVNMADRLGKVIPSDKLTNAQNALSKIDQSLIQSEEEGKLVHEAWDKVSPINGVRAETLLKREDVDPNAEIYLIKDKASGQVIYFQPHEPGISGLKRMTSTNVLTVADTHKIQVATDRANIRVIEQAFKNLGI